MLAQKGPHWVMQRLKATHSTSRTGPFEQEEKGRNEGGKFKFSLVFFTLIHFSPSFFFSTKDNRRKQPFILKLGSGSRGSWSKGAKTRERERERREEKRRDEENSQVCPFLSLCSEFFCAFRPSHRPLSVPAVHVSFSHASALLTFCTPSLHEHRRRLVIPCDVITKSSPASPCKSWVIALTLSWFICNQSSLTRQMCSTLLPPRRIKAQISRNRSKSHGRLVELGGQIVTLLKVKEGMER